MQRAAMAFAFCFCAMGAPAKAKADPLPVTRQARACLAWDAEINHALSWSERYALHAPALREAIRIEVAKLHDRCMRDISMASLNRYSMLLKLLYDDEADDFESFD